MCTVLEARFDKVLPTVVAYKYLCGKKVESQDTGQGRIQDFFKVVRTYDAFLPHPFKSARTPFAPLFRAPFSSSKNTIAKNRGREKYDRSQCHLPAPLNTPLTGIDLKK